MVNFELNQEKPMTFNIFEYLLKESGGSIAAACGGGAVVFTFIGNLSEWVAICGGAVALVGGGLGIVSKFQEIRLNRLKYIEYIKSIERDDKLFEEAKEAGIRDRIKNEVLNTIK